MLFDPDTLYRTDDPKLLVLGVYSTLAAGALKVEDRRSSRSGAGCITAAET